MRDEFDVVVIGAGIAGASTAWRLAQAGQRVALVERTTPANSAGSSHGSARIFRYAYIDELYATMVRDSLPGWRDLETEAGRKLIDHTGAVDLGSDEHIAELARVLDGIGVANEIVPAADAVVRWPGIRPTNTVLFHAAAGVLDAESTVLALVAAAVSRGAVLLEHWPVGSVERGGGGFVVVSESGERLQAARVVVAAGGWIPRLLHSLDLPPEFVAAMPTFSVKQENAFHFPYATEPSEPWPTIIDSGDGVDVYALAGGRDAEHRGHKLAYFNGGTPLADASEQTGQIDAQARERAIAYVREHLPELVPEPYAETTCLFTNTPTEDFVIDTHDGLTIVSACSGHGAKFAPMLGELAARLVLGTGDVPSRFRPSRAQGHSAD